MFPFLRRRVLTSLVPLLFVLLGVFVLARLTGSPASLYLPESATPAQREAFAERNGLDDPIWQQFLDYVNGVLHLDFGTSLRTGESAAEMALRAFPATLQLATVTMLIAVVMAVVIGSWAAYRPNSIADRFASLLSMTAASLPDFWIAIMGIWIFAVTLGWLPTSGTDARGAVLGAADRHPRDQTGGCADPGGARSHGVRAVGAVRPAGSQQGRHRCPRGQPPRAAQRRGARSHRRR